MCRKRSSDLGDVAGRLGFTLVELLVVIAIIAILMSIMVPGLRKARAAAQRTQCAANQRNIFIAMRAYLHDSNNVLFVASNQPRWYDLGRHSKNTGEQLDRWHRQAYWGVAYSSYGADRDVFKCPSKKVNNGWQNEIKPEDKKAFDYSDYGLNTFLCWMEPTENYSMVEIETAGRRKIHEFRRPSETIVLHDHIEPTLEGNGDSYYIRRGDTENLAQWKRYERDNPAQYAGSVRECWRHDGSSNILWLDGHISNQKETTGEDFKYIWYTGGVGGLRDG